MFDHDLKRGLHPPFVDNAQRLLTANGTTTQTRLAVLAEVSNPLFDGAQAHTKLGCFRLVATGEHTPGVILWSRFTRCSQFN